jgi:hypothetical protein
MNPLQAWRIFNLRRNVQRMQWLGGKMGGCCNVTGCRSLVSMTCIG